MEKLKDILYDKNDLLVALIILLVAGIIITTRINVIMNYPQTLTAEKHGNILESDLMNKDDEQTSSNENDENSGGIIQGAPNTNPADSDKAGEGDSGKKDDSDKPNSSAGSNAPAPYSVYIPYGSTPTSIAQTLVDCGLIENKSDFISAVTAAGADSKLKAGTFTIPADSTPEQIVQIIAK